MRCQHLEESARYLLPTSESPEERLRRITKVYDAKSAMIKAFLRLAKEHWRSNVEAGLPKLKELPKCSQDSLEGFFSMFYPLSGGFDEIFEEYAAKLTTTRTLCRQVQRKLNATITGEVERRRNKLMKPYRHDNDGDPLTSTVNNYAKSEHALIKTAVKCFDGFSGKVLATIHKWKRVEEVLEYRGHSEHGEAKALYFKCIMLQLRKQTVLIDSEDSNDEKDTNLPELLNGDIVVSQDFETFERRHRATIDHEWGQLDNDQNTERCLCYDKNKKSRPKRRRDNMEGSGLYSKGYGSDQLQKRAREGRRSCK
jgi:hypothetical protein